MPLAPILKYSIPPFSSPHCNTCTVIYISYGLAISISLGIGPLLKDLKLPDYDLANRIAMVTATMRKAFHRSLSRFYDRSKHVT